MRTDPASKLESAPIPESLLVERANPGGKPDPHEEIVDSKGESRRSFALQLAVEIAQQHATVEGAVKINLDQVLKDAASIESFLKGPTV